MAGNLSTVGAALVGKWLFSDSAVTRPTQWFLALYTSPPSNAGGGVEVTDAGYSRQEITFDSDGALNDADLVFGPAVTGFGLVTHGAIFDDGGRFLTWAALSPSQTIPSGAEMTITAGELSAMFS